MTLEWIPRQKSKTQLQNVCPDEEQTCCRRTGGEFWKVYAANGWDVYDDPEYVAGSCHGRGIGPDQVLSGVLQEGDRATDEPQVK